MALDKAGVLGYSRVVVKVSKAVNDLSAVANRPALFIILPATTLSKFIRIRDVEDLMGKDSHKRSTGVD